MQHHNIYPSTKTFGVLATGCYKEEQGMQLLQEIDVSLYKFVMLYVTFHLVTLCYFLDCKTVGLVLEDFSLTTTFTFTECRLESKH